MYFKLEFDISSLIFLLILHVSLLTQKKFTTRVFRACSYLILNEMIFILLNIVTSITLVRFPEKVIFNSIVCMIQTIFNCLFPVLFLVFIYATTHQESHIPKRFWRTITAVVVIETVLIFSTPLTNFLFIMTEDYYAHSYGYFILYAFSTALLLAAVIEVFRNKRKINHKQRISVFIFTVASVVSIISQIFWNELQLTGIACSVTVFAAALSLHSPAAYFDHSTGALNKLAFREILFSPKHRTNSSVIVFKFTNTNKLKDVFGIEGRYNITRQLMDTIRETCNTEKVFYLFNDTYVILFDQDFQAEEYGRKLLALITNPIEVFPQSTSKNSIKYVLSGRIYVINKISTLYRSSDEKTVYTSDEIVSLISYISGIHPKNSYAIITPDIIFDFEEKVRIHRIVEKAIQEESFEVFLQPIYSIKQNAFVGAEALLRLKDDNGNYISPMRFIPEAEANGDILKISDIMIQKTCEFINKTNLFDKGIQTVNINLSMIQCMYEGIVDHICKILEKNNISPTLIRFEITESVSVNDEARFARLLEEMKARGIEYALDDYGTGYSNTSKLLNHSFSEIKFDKSLIDSIKENEENENAIRYLFELTKEKKMISLAEGVETKEVAELLKKIGCDMIQGFYFAHPMNSDDFETFLSEHN